MRLVAVIVTYNRCALLERCVEALVLQSERLDSVLVIDNASSDGTTDRIQHLQQHTSVHIEYVRLSENLGGAGGFAEGLRRAVASGADWIWMMDDDAEPEPDALECLLNQIQSDIAIYGSTAITNAGTLCWPLYSVDGTSYATLGEVPNTTEVSALPFLGILIPMRIVESIGYPDADYFIAGDDTEYCFRARTRGFSVNVVGQSRVRHPPSKYYRFGIGRWAPVCFVIAPWKRYYDVRNRILTSRQSGKIHVWTRTIPATMLRMVGTLINEPDRLTQLRAYGAGIIDGIRQMKGKRHQKWGLTS